MKRLVWKYAVWDEMDTNLCTVCLDDLNEEHSHTLDACGHSFHSHCLIRWFQRGNLSCPTCRSDAHEENALPCMALQDRASYIRRTIGRRATAPAELKALISKLRDAEQRQRDRQREYTNFRRTHTIILKQMHALRAKRFSSWRAVRKYQRLVGLYQCPSFTLPSLVVTRYNF